MRRVALVAYLLVLTWSWSTRGIPFERAQVLVWVAGGLTIATIGVAGGGIRMILRDWLPLGLILAAYDLTRGVADTLGMPVQVQSLVDAERFLMGGNVPTVWAQLHLGPYEGPARWWEVPVALTYTSHFVASFAVLAVLWVRNRNHFRSLRRRFLTLTGLGLATYVLVPAAPPWFASDRGLIGPVERVGLRGFEMFDLHIADALISYGGRFGNQVAALPSLHAGWSALLALFAARFTPRWAWPLLAAYPLGMGVALVISGEHYVVDILLGYLFAAATIWVWSILERRRAGIPGRAATPSARSGDVVSSATPSGRR